VSQQRAPRVSIITATYNRSDVLRCAIETVLHQTVADWEYVIAGDHCTDDTADVVASFGDPRIRFVNRETNFGEQSVPNNEAFALTSAPYIAYLNHDDLWFPDHLETLLAYIEATGADLVYSVPFAVDAQGLTFCGATNSELRYDPSHFLVASLWLLRRDLLEALGGWRHAVDTHAVTPSQDLLTRAWQQGKDLRCCPKVTALFLPAGGRAQAYSQRDSRQHEALLAAMKQPGMREEMLTRHAMQASRQLDELRRTPGVRGRLDRAFDAAIKALRWRPDAVRNRLARRKPGWVVDQLREMHGMKSLEREKKKG
jgi:hypothetical protein